MASDCKDSPEISGTLIVMPENNAFAVQKAPETPKSNAIHARVCRSLMMSVVYVIFVYSVRSLLFLYNVYLSSHVL